MNQELSKLLGLAYHRQLRPAEASKLATLVTKLQADNERLQVLAQPGLAQRAEGAASISLAPTGALLVHLPGGTSGHTCRFAPGSTDESAAQAFHALRKLLEARDCQPQAKLLATPAAPTNAQIEAMIRKAEAEGKVQKLPPKGSRPSGAKPPQRRLVLADLKINLSDLKV